MRTAAVLLATLVAFAGVDQAMAQVGVGAPPAPTEEERLEQEAAKSDFGWGANVSINQSVGAGTFVADEYVRRAAYDLSFGVSPYVRYQDFRLSLGLGLSASLVENYESNATYEKRWILSDTNLSLRYAPSGLAEYLLGIRPSFGLSFSFPTSPQSHYRQLYFSGSARVGLYRGFETPVGNFAVAYSFGFFKNFNKYTTPAISISEVGDHVILAHFEGNEQLTTDLVSTGGSNTSFGVTNSLSVSYSPISVLSLTIGYDINNSWTYQSKPLDEYSSDYAVSGRGQRDSHGGTVDLSYDLSEVLEYPGLSVSLGVQTFVAPKTADNKAFIFPFMNFSDNYRNNTYMYLSVSGAF